MSNIGYSFSELIKKVYKLSGIKADFNYPIQEYPLTTSNNKILSFFEGIFSQKNVIEISERIVENPFVLNNIRLKNSLKVLEVGCCRSHLAIELASLGCEVTAVDLKEYIYKHPNLHFIRGDLRYLKIPKNSFDVVTAISTIEHTGMGAYKEKKSGNGDVEMVEEINKLLKLDGKLLITLPFGTYETNEHERIYDRKRLSLLLKRFEIKKAEYYKGLGRKYWIKSTSKELEKVSSIDKGYTQGIVCIVAIKKY